MAYICMGIVCIGMCCDCPLYCGVYMYMCVRVFVHTCACKTLAHPNCAILALSYHHSNMRPLYQHADFKSDRCESAIAQCDVCLFLPGMSITMLYANDKMYNVWVAQCQERVWCDTMLPRGQDLSWLVEKRTILNWLQERGYSRCGMQLR